MPPVEPDQSRLSRLLRRCRGFSRRLGGASRPSDGWIEAIQALEPRMLLDAQPLVIEAFEPLGAMVHRAQASGTLDMPSDADDHLLALNGGQRLSVALRPREAGLRGRVELLNGIGQLVDAAEASAAGGMAALQSILIAPSGGNYTLRTISLEGDGDFTLDLVLNAGLEAESIGGPPNDLPAQAQAIGASSLPMMIGDRLAMLGALDGTDDSYSFTLAPGQSLDAALTTIDSPDRFHSSFSAPFNGYLQQIRIGDVDGDGNQDFIGYGWSSGGSFSYLLQVLPGDGQGGFGEASTTLLGNDYYSLLQAGDFNGDGRTDVAGSKSGYGGGGFPIDLNFHFGQTY